MASSRSQFYVPTPLEIAVFLTVVVLLMATFFTNHTLVENMEFWGNGLWALLAFMTQMSLVLMGGFVVASSRPVHKLLVKLACYPHQLSQVYLLTFLVSSFACWLNWGLGLVVGAFFALEVGKQNKNAHFPLVVACSYIGFLFWHAGLSGSIPLLVSTPENFSYQWLGQLIYFDETIFSVFNLLLILSLLLSLSSLLYFFYLQSEKKSKIFLSHDSNLSTDEEVNSGEPTYFSGFAFWILLTLIGSYVFYLIFDKKFSVSLNQVNLLLIGAGLFLQGSLHNYMLSVKRACGRLAPILVQYPLYAGIMGVMIKSGLAVQLSNSFVQLSSVKTYPLYMFLSAGLVNLFVPSGGGQWAVQAPVVIAGAKALGVPLWKVILAVSWGDAWTNLAQPFWALPLLSIVGLGIAEIMKYCLLALLLSGAVISLFFLFL